MRLMCIIYICLLCCTVTMANEQYTVKVAITDESSPRGAGIMLVPEGEFGRIVIKFYNHGQDFRIYTPGTKVDNIGPVDDDQPSLFMGNLFAYLDMYLKPLAVKPDKVTIKGTIDVSVNTSSGQAASLPLRFTRRTVDMTFGDGASGTIIVRSPSGDSLTTLTISAYSSRMPLPEPSQPESFSLETEYSMYNITDNKMEINKSECRLSSENDAQGSKECTIRCAFTAANGDIILYLLNYRVENMQKVGDTLNIYDFKATRIFAVNPDDTAMPLNELSSQQITMKLFSKSIQSAPNERIDISLPTLSESPLPFLAKERIIMYPTDDFIAIDVAPEMIYQEAPVFPKAALEEGVNCDVWVQAYLDRDGVPKKVFIKSCDRPGFGFEQAARVAAYKNRYKPAMSKGQPVAIWITYKVSFVLH